MIYNWGFLTQLCTKENLAATESPAKTLWIDIQCIQISAGVTVPNPE